MRVKTGYSMIALSALAAIGCSVDAGGGTETNAAYDDDAVGSLSIELKNAPSAVRCILVTAVNGANTVTGSFAVTGGQSTATIDMGKLALGSTALSAKAFNVACASATGVPDWVGATVTVTIRAGINSAVTLNLLPNVSTTVGVDFRSPIVDLQANQNSTHAVLADGSVRAWGYNFYNQLADGTTTTRLTPVTSTLLTNIAQISNAKSASHTCAITTAGALLCWGANDQGQLGDATTTPRTTPGQVASGILQVSVGGSLAPPRNSFTCAIRASDERVICTGDNQRGQLGIGTMIDQGSFVPTTSSGAVTQVVAGLDGACALNKGGTVSCWGNNEWGQIGNNTTSPAQLTPTGVSNLASVVELAAGLHFFCARRADGTMWCWGRNGNGQLGDGTTTTRTVPTQIPSITSAVEIAAGEWSTCVRMLDESVRCWGYSPAIGNGTGTDQLSPVTVRGLSGAQSLTMGQSHACARQVSGEVFCWGRNQEGEVGDGTTIYRAIASPSLL